MKQARSSVWEIVPWVLLCEVTGLVGSVFTSSAIPTWYATLQKPALNPPSWVFGPVWTILYALMGCAAFLIWRKGWEKKEVKGALGIFSVQLLLNGVWSGIFFGAQNTLLALVDILLLLCALVLTMWYFSRLSKRAALLLLPYLVWVSFATYLNWSIHLLN